MCVEWDSINYYVRTIGIYIYILSVMIYLPETLYAEYFLYEDFN